MQPLPNYRAGDIPGAVGSPIVGPPTPQMQGGMSAGDMVQGVLKAFTPNRAPMTPAQQAQVWQSANHSPRQSIGQYLQDNLSSLDPRKPAGLASLAAMFMPGGLSSKDIPSELPTSVPDVRILRAPRNNGDFRDYSGHSATTYSLPDGIGKGSARVVYNAHHANGNILGSIEAVLDKDSTYINSLYVNPAYRKTPLFQDLLRPAFDRGKPITGSIINDRLAAVAAKMAKRNPLIEAGHIRKG